MSRAVLRGDGWRGDGRGTSALRRLAESRRSFHRSSATTSRQRCWSSRAARPTQLVIGNLAPSRDAGDVRGHRVRAWCGTPSTSTCHMSTTRRRAAGAGCPAVQLRPPYAGPGLGAGHAAAAGRGGHRRPRPRRSGFPRRRPFSRPCQRPRRGWNGLLSRVAAPAAQLLPDPRFNAFTISGRESVITLVRGVGLARRHGLRPGRRADRPRRQRRATMLASSPAPCSIAPTHCTGASPDPRALSLTRAILERRDAGGTFGCRGNERVTAPRADVDIAVDPDTHLVARRALAGKRTPSARRRPGQARLALRNQQVNTEAAEARRPADATSCARPCSGRRPRHATPLTSIRPPPGACARGPAASGPTAYELADTIGVRRPAHRRGHNRAILRIATGATDARRALRRDRAAGPARLDDPTAPHQVADDMQGADGPRTAGGVVAKWSTRAAPRPRCPSDPRKPHANRVELRVVDAGPGVPGASPTGVRRSSGSATGSRAGSALGSASRRAQQAWRHVTAETPPEGGSRRSQPPGGAPGGAPGLPRARDAANPPSSRRDRVLICDDDIQLLRALRDKTSPRAVPGSPRPRPDGAARGRRTDPTSSS